MNPNFYRHPPFGKQEYYNTCLPKGQLNDRTGGFCYDQSGSQSAAIASIEKLSTIRLQEIIAVATLLRNYQNPKYKGDVDVLIARMLLLEAALNAHPDDVTRMLKWAKAVESNGKKDRAEKEVAV